MKKTTLTPPTYTQKELAALSSISESLHATSKPSLGLRYRILASFVVLLGLGAGSIAIVNPEFFVSELISPSIDFTDTLERNTRARGLITMILVGLWLYSHLKRNLTVKLLGVALAWVTLMTIADLYKLLVLDIYTSTLSTTVFLLLRPTLIVILATMLKDYSRYKRALEHY